MDLLNYKEKLKNQILEVICDRVWNTSKQVSSMVIIKRHYINSNIDYAKRKYNIILTEEAIREKIEEKAKKFSKKISVI